MSEPKDWILDVDARTFEKEVLERSRELPVVVDFWAAWCGPCKTLGPALERRAREGAGRFVLAKVDVDRNPELAQAFRVQGIPTVLALRAGKLVDGFQGALPDPELDAFLERVAPGGASTGVVAEADRMAAEGDVEGAVRHLRAFLREEPDHAAARLRLAALLVGSGKAREARLVFDKLAAEDAASSEARAVEAQIAFAEGAGDLEELRRAAAERPEDPAARIALGKALVGTRDYAAGLEELLEAVKLDPAHDGGAARKAMLEVFEILGLEDPLANEYRFKLSMQLLV
jgi:putative thioredoxin